MDSIFEDHFTSSSANINEKLDDQSKKLDEHREILKQHGENLKEHGRIAFNASTCLRLDS
jgi:hypothetical protein